MARITVVDDYPEFLEMVSAVLDGLHGHDVTGFEGDGTTVDDIVGSSPDLLIVDLGAAQRDAPELSVAAVAGADARLAHVPVIICSGDVDALRRWDEEFTGRPMLTLEKPFGVEQLTSIVRQALNGNAEPRGIAGEPTAGASSSRNPATAST